MGACTKQISAEDIQPGSPSKNRKHTNQENVNTLTLKQGARYSQITSQSDTTVLDKWALREPKITRGGSAEAKDKCAQFYTSSKRQLDKGKVQHFASITAALMTCNKN